MKRLYILRHAEAMAGNPECKDIDRALSLHGMQQLQAISALLKKYANLPELILHSPAKRTTDTALAMAKAAPHATIQAVPDLYQVDDRMLLEMIQTLDDRYFSVMIVGHNPVLSMLLRDLSIEKNYSLGTCGICCLEFDVAQWCEIDFSKTGTIQLLESPP